MDKSSSIVLKKYEEANDWLLSLITDPNGKRYLKEKSETTRKKEYKEQIRRTTALLKFFGNPQEKYRSIHVAGTGGKGSVTTMIGAVLSRAGFKVGVHTSPYLQVPNEKLLINGIMISPSTFTNLITEFRKGFQTFVAAHPDMVPNYGEAWVTLTHLYFAKEKVDWGIIETGMGGRFDPTNVLTPEISVITNIELDHVPQLGTTLEDIAFHKAGIIKEGKPIITSERKPGPLSVIQQEATKKHARLFLSEKDFDVHVISVSQKGSIVDINTPFGNYHNIPISLTGTFQPENAATAVMAITALGQKHNISITNDIITAALSSLKHPGRMETVQEHPTVILDGAHNPQKMRALAQLMKEIFGTKPFTLIVGMLSTKDAAHSLAPILKNTKRVIATTPHVLGKPSITPEQMKNIIHTIDPQKPVEEKNNILDAIHGTINKAYPNDIIVVTGSLYMLGEARSYWFPNEQILLHAEYGHE